MVLSLLSFSACQQDERGATYTTSGENAVPEYPITNVHAFFMTDIYDINGSDSLGDPVEGNISDRAYFLIDASRWYRIDRSVVYDFSANLLELTESRLTSSDTPSQGTIILSRQCRLDSFPQATPIYVPHGYSTDWKSFDCNDSTTMKRRFHLTDIQDNIQYLVETFAFFDEAGTQTDAEIWTYELSADANISIKKRLISLLVEDLENNRTRLLTATSGTSVFDK